MAYFFFLDGVLLPVPPSALTTKIKNKNKTIELIKEAEVNILKDAGLTEVSFKAMLPNMHYPFARYQDGFVGASYYLGKLEALKKSKKPFQFIISRRMPNGQVLPHTNMTVSLENYDITENGGDFDFSVAIELKQYRPFGTKSARIKSSGDGTATIRKEPVRDTKESGSNYTVIKGDTLWNIAKQEYGAGVDWEKIYEANKETIEATAGEYGKPSSSNGWWIYPGTELVLP